MKTKQYYLDLAEQFLKTTPFDKAAEQRVRTVIALAQVAAPDLPSKGAAITYANDQAAAQFRAFLYGEKRDMVSGGAYPGSGSGYFSPLGFFPAVIAMLAQLDSLFDPDVVNVVQTKRGTPFGFPVLADELNSATVVDENDVIPDQDSLMNGVVLPKCPTWKTGFFASLELVQDSGVPLDVWVAAAFAIRLQRGLGAANVATLLAGATRAAIANGVGNEIGKDGSNSIDSSDLFAAINALDAAYLNNPKCAWIMCKSTLSSLLSEKTTTGALIFHPDRDADGNLMLLDFPVRLCPSMPGIGANNKAVVLADLSRFIVREVLGGMSLGIFPERGAETGQVYYRGTWRAQGALLQTSNTPSDPSPAVYIQCASS